MLWHILRLTINAGLFQAVSRAISQCFESMPRKCKLYPEAWVRPPGGTGGRVPPVKHSGGCPPEIAGYEDFFKELTKK